MKQSYSRAFDLVCHLDYIRSSWIFFLLPSRFLFRKLIFKYCQEPHVRNIFQISFSSSPYLTLSSYMFSSQCSLQIVPTLLHTSLSSFFPSLKFWSFAFYVLSFNFCVTSDDSQTWVCISYLSAFTSPRLPPL